MSNENQAGLPDPQDAYNHLFDGVHAEVFFGKLASYGIQPSSEKEAADLLQLAGQLRHVDSSEKQASEGSRFGGAVEALNSAFNNTPAGQQKQAEAKGEAIKQAAEQLMQDSDIYASVLSLKAAEAAVLAGQE
jgi:hypothetical protein